MTATASEDRVEQLLAGLNPPQREAVVHGDGPLLILAGAGSGKTRVLTHRIAHLVLTGAAQPNEILAITFTNKAAQEMRERVELLLGRRTRAMWIMTFHAACARMLRAEAPRLGYTRQFTIYDQSDARRLVKRCLEELDADPKRFTPAAVHSQISDAKNRLRDAEAYRQLVGSYFEQTVADVYELYESELLRMNAMDFDDLLVRAVNVLELFPEVRERYAGAFRHVLVDEYQDTNHAQYRWLQLLTSGEHRNLAVVGDDDQCLVEGTRIAMADGSTKAIEDVRAGDLVLSGYGSGSYRPARVSSVFRSNRSQGVKITTRSGRTIVSTPEHVHFAGYRVGLSPELHVTYLMYRQGVGFRIGTSSTYVRGQRRPIMGFKLRSLHEHADGSWIVSTHASEREARLDEALLSLRYRLPTPPFVARKTSSTSTAVGDQAAIDRVFAEVDTETGALALLEAEDLDPYAPHHAPQTHLGRRRNLVVTLCGDARGRRPMHRVALFGQDDEGRKALESLGLPVRPARRGASTWRYESAFATAEGALDVVDRISEALDVTMRCVARLGREEETGKGFSLPFTCARSVRPGMAMFTSDGGWDVVTDVERVAIDGPVYDLNIEDTHNFVANGLVTHNSIYGFRGADINNLLDFDADYADAAVVRLEQNYRSTQTILDAANAVIRNNRGRKGKKLWTDVGEGDPIVVRELDDERAEARYVVGEIERLGDEGVSRGEVAIFYRTNAQSRALEDVLREREIGYQVVGGVRFYDRAEVKDALAYLSLLVNDQDVICFQRVANSPKRGLGQTSLSRVLSHAATMGLSVWDAAADATAVPGLGTAAQKALRRFMETMESLRDRAREDVPVGDLLEAVLHETGYLDALEAERTFEAQGRIENLQELVTAAREFDASAEEGEGLEAYLQRVSLVSDADTRRDDEGVVTLMTLHNAKGLEYPIVFIAGLEEGVFPHSRALDEGGLEEERRLCYVGITRAMRNLYLTCARRRSVFGTQAFGLRSRFLDEVPMELVDRDASDDLRPGAGAPPAGRATSWGAVRREAPAVEFHTGEDVVHAAFGEGVVTGVEPGGIVAIRFARDGSERKLMAEYAPLSRR